LTDLAHRQATELGGPAPEREQITLGHPDIVELWGRFVCGKTCYVGDGAKEPRGNYARITVDPVTRTVDGFELRTVALRHHKRSSSSFSRRDESG
jgi:hypothetical protein